MTSAQEWVPKISRDLKLLAEWKSEVNAIVNKQTWWLDFNTGRCEMWNSVRLLVLFLAAQYMVDSSDDLLDLLAAPLFFRHTNRHRINGRKQRNREQEIRFLHYRRVIELHHYAILHVLEADGVPIERHKVKSTSQVFGNGPVKTAPLLEFF